MTSVFMLNTHWLGTAMFGVNCWGMENPLVWRLIGVEQRPALFDKQPGSFEKFIFAAEYHDVTMMDIANPRHRRPPVSKTEEHSVWEVDVSTYKRDPDENQIIACPLNLHVLARTGVPGLPWQVGASLNVLSDEIASIDVRHRYNFGHLDD